jgi:hypothetical protein
LAVRMLAKSVERCLKRVKSIRGSILHRQTLWCATLVLALPAGIYRVSDDPVHVQAEVGRGPYFVGQGIDFRISVAGGRHPPKIELPAIQSARAWQIGTDSKPISRSGIGSIVGEENLFVTRFRLVPTRPEMLQIPSVPVRVDDRSGRSQSLKVEVLPVPAAGRPASFLGGIGRFTLRADVSASAVRVGQEFDFRITVSGPAAWGMTEPPELTRYDRVPLGLRIRTGPTQTKDEPPERTFTYRLRPTRPGDAVLPPVSIAAFEPALSRFMTQVTPSVPIRVVAVSPFDPATIDDGPLSSRASRLADGQWVAWSLSAFALVAGGMSLALVRKRLRDRRRAGESAARHFAARLARNLSPDDSVAGTAERDNSGVAPPMIDAQEGPLRRAARRVRDLLIRYLELGIERPPGALTPDEASAGVALVTRSADLGAKAGQLMACSDRVLYGESSAEIGEPEFLEEARALFEALGNAKQS